VPGFLRGKKEWKTIEDKGESRERGRKKKKKRKVEFPLIVWEWRVLLT